MFVFSLSRWLYRDYIVVCVLGTHCCLCIRILVYPFFLMLVVVGLFGTNSMYLLAKLHNNLQPKLQIFPSYTLQSQWKSTSSLQLLFRCMSYYIPLWIIYVHICIHDCNPSFSNTTQLIIPLLLCVLILYMRGGTCSFNLTPNNRFIENCFHEKFICFQSFCQNSATRKSTAKYFLFVFRYVGAGLYTMASYPIR